MADVDLPEDLITLRKAFLAVQERLAAAGRAMPSHAAVSAGEAEPASEEQQQEWSNLQEEARRLAVQIDGHPFWAEAPDRAAARKALDSITADEPLRPAVEAE